MNQQPTNKLLICGLVVMCAVISGCSNNQSGSGDQNVRVAYVTNNAANFWLIAKAGVQAAEKDFDVSCDFRMPGDGTVDTQQGVVKSLVAAGVSGIAISPNNPADQTEFLNEIAGRVNLICHDSDAPQSNRLCYIGTNNIAAGESAGQLIKEAIGDEGTIALFVGFADAQNAIERVQGIRNALADTSIRILPVYTDETNQEKARQNVSDALTAHPDLRCLVGIWSFNGPQIVSVIEERNLKGKVAAVTFDEELDVLNGIKDGIVHGTVVQQPYKFGYESVRVLAALARGESVDIPEDKIIDVPVRQITSDNVDEFRAELDSLLGN